MKKLLGKIVGFITALFGTGMLLFVIVPIVSFDLSGVSGANEYLSPIPFGQELYARSASEEAERDMTKASNWFVGASASGDFAAGGIRYYTISVPRLSVRNATVAIGGENLADSLIQYPGTALPGKLGNAVIFGHSVLPQFFNPKDYLTIFSTLNKLKTNDQVSVSFDGITYNYYVESMFEVQPTDLQILEQNTSDSFLTLVTCSPPGHPLKPKRLVVRARLAPNTGVQI